MLLAYLDQQREAVLWKLEGVDEDQARWRPREQANSLLNLLVHLTGVERRWSEQVLAGNTIDRDRDAEFGELADTTVAQARDAYRTAVERTNEIANAMKPDDACRGEAGYSVRWVLIHLIEETARHAGHADITRELVDGAVGLSADVRE
jgi:uncharacterized damage-inducible protein DinB